MLAKALLFSQGGTISAPSIPWVTRFNHRLYDNTGGVCTDADGYIYTTGATYSQNNMYAATLTKYDPNGYIIWQRLVLQSANHTYGLSICLDAAGNIYTGLNTNNIGGLLFKWSPDGVATWKRQIYGDVGAGSVMSVAVDGSGNVFAAVRGTLVSSGNIQHALMKYDSAGTLLWKRRYKYGTTASTYCNSVVVDSEGNAYIGIHLGLTSGGDGTLVKYNTNGTIVWARSITGAVGNIHYLYSLALDGLGNIYAVGNLVETGGNRTVVAKWTLSGTLVWKKFVYQSTIATVPNCICVSKKNPNDLYIVTTQNTGASRDGAIIKIDSEGNYVWDKILYGTASLEDFATAVTTNSAGDVFVYAQSNFAGYYDTYLIKMLPTGIGNGTYGNLNIGHWDGTFTISDCTRTEGAGQGTDIASPLGSATCTQPAYPSEDYYAIP